MPDAYPLVFEPMLLAKVWGGRRLERFGKRLPTGERIGESWEIADLPSTSAGGAGGGPRCSVVASGPMKGRGIGEVLAGWGDSFPLLVKLLDAREHLSVQVHPSPAYAAAHPGAHLKCECWYVLAAEPGSVIYKGVRPGVSAASFRHAIESGTVPQVMLSVPAVVGQAHELPSGTVHALGAGVLVAEVQTPSDTTFRVYDWAEEYGRAGRELHIDEAMACIDWGPAPAAGTGDPLCDNAHFRVREVRGHCQEVELGPLPGCVGVMIVGGMGASLASRSGSFEEVPGRPGTTVLIPSACGPDAVLRAGPGTVALVIEPKS
jgi:mannose-6-phosphate isomerase